MARSRPVHLVLVTGLLLSPLVVACSSGGSGAGVTVAAGPGTCTVTPGTVPAGQVTVTATWAGDGPGEVYLYGEEAGAFTRVVGEVEDLTDGLTSSFTADVPAGRYEIACKAGSDEVGSRAPLTAG